MRGDKSKYSEEQVRQAQGYISKKGTRTEGFEQTSPNVALGEYVNKMTGGGRKPGGSGRGKAVNKAPAKKGGRIGGARGRPEQGRAFPRRRRNHAHAATPTNRHPVTFCGRVYLPDFEFRPAQCPVIHTCDRFPKTAR